jgi:hypothetical protein
MKPSRIVALVASVWLTACAAGPIPTPLVGSTLVPAAQGSVIASPGANGNTRLLVQVKHLAPPERVSPSAKTYVVWVRPAGGSAQNVGAIVVDDNLSGRLETLTPLQTFDLFITAEPYPAIPGPRGPQVLVAQISQ